jgi:hypothetical protein
MNIYDIELRPCGHGVYRVKVTMENGYKVTLIVADMTLIDEWNDGNKEPLINHINNKL